MERVAGKEVKQANRMSPSSAGPKEDGPRGSQAPKERPHTAGVGNETKFSPKAFNTPGEGHLRGAVKELHSQHPIPYHDHGPHHGTDHHVRHEPLHGLKTEAHRHHGEAKSPSQRERYGR